MQSSRVEQWYCRVAPSLGSFEGHPNDVWGVKTYDPVKHMDKPTVFWGLYGLPDFYALWRHKGRKAVFWTGSDIRHFVNGYWLEEGGRIKLDPEPLAYWLDEHCEHWVENRIEAERLADWGISSKVVPSFLGDIKKFPITYKWSERPKLYTSVSGDDFDLYGWPKIPALARDNPNIEFHLFGNTRSWKTKEKNVFVHGRLPMQEMNKQIKQMQGALRLVEFEGFSEIVAKSLLWGQHPVSAIDYPHTLSIDELRSISGKRKPNKSGRDWLLKYVNRFPWNKNI